MIVSVDFHLLQLAPIKYPLVNKFYDRYKVKGRAKSHDDVWVGYISHQIVAACRIQYVGNHLFLSTLFVDPLHRDKGYGKRIIQTIQSTYHTDIYLFADAQLTAFYTLIGFVQEHSLPSELADMFKLYQKHNSFLRSFLSTN